MTKRERIRAAVGGGKPDKLPFSLWTHLPGIDLDPVLLAEKTYEFYKTYDVDFIKTMNNGMYAIEDFGCTVDYSEIEKGGVAKVTGTPVAEPPDWIKLTRCPFTEGSLKRELTSLKLLLEKTADEDVPVLFTVFSPITIADKISGKRLLNHIHNGYGSMVKQALEVITETTAELAKEAVRLGADGVFFASQMSTYDTMTAEEYQEYGKPYDLRVLKAAKNGWFNTIHAHGNNIMFDVLRDYPTAAFNWHAGETLPTLDEAYLLTGKCLMGGLKRMDITSRNKNEIQNQIYESFKTMGGQHQILTPGCVIRYPLDDEMLCYVKRIKETIENRLGETRPVKIMAATASA